MPLRKNAVRLGTVGLAAASIALTSLAPALADAGPSTNPNLGTDIIGVGSDTTQWVMDQLTTDYNAAHSTGPRMINYDACLGNTTTGAPGFGDNPDGSGFPCGADHTGTKAGVARDEQVVDSNAPAGHSLPNGSGSGRTLLRTSTDPLFNDVAFGRSSGPINTTDLSAGLKALPFAVDKIVVATNPNGPAPAALTGQQVLKIFNGTYTNWAQVGGSNAPIHAYMPKSGSSTLNAFEAFLAALDGQTEAPGSDNDPSSHSAAQQKWQGPGNTITDSNWNTGATNVEEHDPSVITADANAIEPFSYGRAQLANATSPSVRIEGGWSEDRELYNVVRSQAISGASSTPFLYTDTSPSNVLPSIFGPSGWICTDSTALADVNSAGFWPIASNACGAANNNTVDTINPFGSNGQGEGAATSTTSVVTGRTVNIAVQALNSSDTPTGSVQVVVGAPTTPGQPASNASFTKTVPLDPSGNASVTIPNAVSGNQLVETSFLPTNFGALSNAGGHSMMGSSYSETKANIAPVVAKVGVKPVPSKFPASTVKGRTVTGTVTAKPASGTAKPTGRIQILLGRTVIQTVNLTNGVAHARFAATKLVAHRSNRLTVKYLPSGNFVATSTATVTIKRTR